jgi:hypothetical protein
VYVSGAYSIDPILCYCGLADASDCMNGGAIGLCRAEIEAAAGTSDPAQIMPLLSGSGPVATALKLAGCGMGGFCSPVATGCPWVSPPTGPSPGCGDGVLQPGEQCDPPNGSSCTSSCQFAGGADGGADGGVCADPSPDFTWTHQPAPNYVAGLWSTGAADTWLSVSNALQHWDGARWTTMIDAPPNQSFGTLWASGPNDVWISGSELWRWNGTSLKPMIGFRIAKAWGTGPNDVWAIEYGDTTAANRMYHWDGALWKEHTPALVQGQYPIRIFALWGASPNDIWGMGNVANNFLPTPTQVIMHWDGQSWTPTSALDDPMMQYRFVVGMWGSSNHDIWALESARTTMEMWHYDGVAWTATVSMPTAISPTTAGGVWGSSATDVWATIGGSDGASGVVSHFDGSSWTPVDTGAAAISMLSGEGGGSLWAVGSFASRQAPPVPSLFHRVHGCLGGNNDGGTDGPPSDGGPVWTTEPGVPNLTGLWAVSANEVWRSDTVGVDRWDGTAWNPILALNSGDPVSAWYFGKIWASGSNDVWVGGGSLRHFDGSTWVDRTPNPVANGGFSPAIAISGSAPNDVWTLRQDSTGQGSPYHWDGQAWTGHPFQPIVLPGASSPTLPSVQDLWEAGPSDVWAFGGAYVGNSYGATTYAPAFLHWDGQAWTLASDPTDPAQLNHIPALGWGTSSTNAWAVGNLFTESPLETDLWHYDGAAWKIIDTAAGDPAGYGAVWGTGASDVWASGPAFLWHFDGVSLSRVDLGAYRYTAGTSASPDDVWAGGLFYGGAGALYHRHLP